ncbi:uncharacterized protein Z518_11291 [Rhinocladiella mackenziei CBS 650.93]|uniref:Peptidase S33 tripeptidyl aminopeptidase-like C-terminal domain-containing protein n=1 Tax=Rhinocladiella mackenziei CBS 650.93 TaxID=1442369 RepID=A0A0D2GMH8_9EURO|nr:uncharacterized protein Z518_11291 [Rhinocladiella mackenziei CBS 650.93]KIW99552.1 hypothetical protein Z518_11291 [Rhinocladiella mackenziei CBS 650.93]
MPLTLALIAFGLSTAASALAHARDGKGINFQPCPELNANITAINGVEGTPFDCAKLSVPLDYTDPESEPLELNLFRVNATAEPVLGTVLINFGGPGGTGAENLPAWADEARNNIGAQWNLVSWDPRGTGNTIPFQCNLTALTGAAVTSQKRDVGTLVSTDLTAVFLNGGWEAAGQLADYCLSEASETGTLIGTAFVARDMIKIVDALDEDGLLRFYGWSYGTALGSYAAAMFPERVERMVLDGNLNPHDYQAGHYGEFAHDIDETFAGFLQACFDATDNCALYTLLQPNTTQDLLDAINLALAPLAQNATLGAEAYLSYLSIKSTFVQPLYFPRTWPSFAETLASILNGTITAPASDSTPETYGTADNDVIGIRASDATFIANSSEEYLAQVEYQATISPGFSDVSYFPLWISAQWRMPAKERYWGDFHVKTKTPILYVNGEFDPVTPLVNAYNASAAFEGSVVLPHSGYGHGIFTDPSQCVARHIQAYFKNATLPGEDMRCEPDMSLLQVWQASLQVTESGSSSGGDGNGTMEGGSSSGSDNNSDTEGVEGTASRGSTSVEFAFAMILAITAMNVL